MQFLHDLVILHLLLLVSNHVRGAWKARQAMLPPPPLRPRIGVGVRNNSSRGAHPLPPLPLGLGGGGLVVLRLGGGLPEGVVLGRIVIFVVEIIVNTDGILGAERARCVLGVNLFRHMIK